MPLLIDSLYLFTEQSLPESARQFSWLATYSTGVALGALIISASKLWRTALVVGYLIAIQFISFFYVVVFECIVFGKWI